MGKGIVDQLKKNYDIQDTWISYELHPETPPNGILLSQRFKGLDVSLMYDHLRKRGKEFGIIFGNRTFLSNSHLALEASEYARDMGKYGLFHEQMFYTYFVESKDIGNIEVVTESARMCGLNTDELQQALKERRYAHRLEDSRREAEKINLTGVPTFIINGKYKIVGAQPVEAFREVFSKRE